MGKIIKISVIVIFVLSLVSFLTVVKLFLTKENEKAKRIQVEGQLKTTEEAKQQVEKELGDTKSAKELVEQDLEQEKTVSQNLADELEREKQAKDELNNQLTQTKGELEKQKQDAERLAQELENEKTDKNSLNEKLTQSEDEKGRLRTELEQVRIAKETLEKKIADIFAEGEVNLDRIIVRPSNAIEGKVIVVDSATDIVVTDLGLKDGIKLGDILTVYRGETFVAKIRVEKVEDDLSAGVVLSEWAKGAIQKEDNVKNLE